MGLKKSIYYGIFHSVSAFCNAGIDIIADDSLCAYALNPVVNFTTMALIFAGGIGFVVWWDVIRVFKEKKYRHLKFLSLHSKLALSTTIVLIVFGALMFFAFEYNNPLTKEQKEIVDKWNKWYANKINNKNDENNESEE